MYRILGAFTKGEKGGSLIEAWQGIANPRALFPGEERTLILVVGKDYNHTNKGIAYTKDARADTIMLLSADLENAKLTAVGIPRDTRVSAPDGVTGKINATFQRGGVGLLKETILSEFGIAPEHYVVLKADAVKALVDAVGGVEVEAADDMFYQDSWGGLDIDLKKGRYRIDGKQAVGFVRFRKTGTHRIGPKGEKIPIHMPASKEEGDIRRAERQQQLVHSLVSEALSPRNLLQADHLIEVAFSQIETDLTRTQVEALATIFKKSGSKDLAGSTIPGTDDTIGDTYYWVPDLERSRLTLDWLLRGNEYSGRQLVRVAVYNGSDERGAARTIAEQLRTEGYEASSNGNAKEKPEHSMVVFRKAAYEDFAQQIARSLGIRDVHKEVGGDPRAYWLPEVKVTLANDLKPAPETTTPRS